MLTSLAFVFLAGLASAPICQRIGLPRIIGMLIAGIVIGPHVFNLLDPSILGISADLRQMALVIILLKAGLTLNLSDLKKVGRPAVLMSFIPACFEVIAYVLFAPQLLGIARIDAAVLGAVMSAVSPAVVVPRMVQLIESQYGTKHCVPQLILAGASCDDVFVIVLFSTFTAMAQGGSARITDFINIPISIFLGIAVGAAVGWMLSLFFEIIRLHQQEIRSSLKTIITLSISFLLLALEAHIKKYIAISGLLAVISMACILQIKCPPSISEKLSAKFGKLWLGAEVLLFVLVGAAVDIRYTLNAGIPAVIMIIAALLIRSTGVFLCLIGTQLNRKERIFCIIAYLPKATVQAAIGAVPLALGLPCGQIILSVAVLGIMITAPLGALGIDCSYSTLLTHDE